MSTQTVHVAVYPDLADWEYGYAAAAINSPQWQTRPGHYAVTTVGESAAPVTSMGGIRIQPDIVLDELDPATSAMLILPGAHGWDGDESGLDRAVWTVTARRFLEAGTPVAAICGATFGLADAGLFDDRDHTSSAAEYLAFADGYHGADRYRETDAVNDRGLITAGTTDPVAFAREILGELEVYRPEVLESWYGLYATHEPRYFYALTSAASS